PLGAAAEAVRTDVARVEVHFAAIGAALQQEPALICGLPVRGGVRQDGGCGDEILVLHQTRSRITVAAVWRVAMDPPMPLARARWQFGTCTAGCASPRSWRTASMILV